MTQFVLFAGILFAFLNLIVVLGVNRNKSAAYAVGFGILWSTLFPMNVADAEYVRLLGLVTTVAAGSIAYLRGRATEIGSEVVPPRRAPLAIFTVFLLSLSLSNFLSGSLSPGVALLYLSAQILAFLALKMGPDGVLRVSKLVGIGVVFHLAYSLGEVFAGLPPIWTMADGSFDIANRSATLLPWTGGRPMTSFGHPIPLGLFFMTSALLLGYLGFRRHLRSHLVLATMALLGMILSSTRSAVLSFAVALLALVLASVTLRSAAKYLVWALLGIACLAMVGFEQLLSLLGLGEGFQGSASYIHRSTVLGSFASLWDRPLQEFLLGSGTDRQQIFAEGLVRGYSNFIFFDNQFIASFAEQGLIGLALVISLAFAILMGRNPLGVALGVSLFCMFFSFDLARYVNPMFMLALTVGIGAHRFTLLEPKSTAKQATPTRGSRPVKGLEGRTPPNRQQSRLHSWSFGSARTDEY